MRVFLDANIVFSAAKSDGAIRFLLDLLITRGHECWIDDYILEEARRNLAAKFPAAMDRFGALVARFAAGRASASVGDVELLAWLPPKDRPVLLSAMHLRCDLLLTGDHKHFGPGYGKAFGGVTVHSARSLAEVLQREG